MVLPKSRYVPRFLHLQEPPKTAFVTARKRELGWPVHPAELRRRTHPPEDSWARSSRFPIFAVADGVTLEPGPDGRYPRPSGAAAVAQIFYHAVIREAAINSFAAEA